MSSCKFPFIPVLSFHKNQKKKKKKKKKESNFQQVGGLLKRNSFAFCL